jgi:hypothetical protein
VSSTSLAGAGAPSTTRWSSTRAIPHLRVSRRPRLALSPPTSTVPFALVQMASINEPLMCFVKVKSGYHEAQALNVASSSEKAIRRGRPLLVVRLQPADVCRVHLVASLRWPRQPKPHPNDPAPHDVGPRRTCQLTCSICSWPANQSEGAIFSPM